MIGDAHGDDLVVAPAGDAWPRPPGDRRDDQLDGLEAPAGARWTSGRPLVAALESSVVVNAVILGVLALGIVVQLAQAAALVPATHWIDRTRRGFAAKKPPRLIAPVAAVLAGREHEGFTLSMLAVRSLIEAARGAVNALVEELAELSDQLRAQQKVMTAISKNHSDLLPAIHDFANQLAGALAGGEELRGHVRKIDVSLARLADDAAHLRVQGFRPSRAA